MQLSGGENESNRIYCPEQQRFQPFCPHKRWWCQPSSCLFWCFWGLTGGNQREKRRIKRTIISWSRSERWDFCTSREKDIFPQLYLLGFSFSIPPPSCLALGKKHTRIFFSGVLLGGMLWWYTAAAVVSKKRSAADCDPCWRIRWFEQLRSNLGWITAGFHEYSRDFPSRLLLLPKRK